mmetsp:Transcript_20567/g.51163  ORF Transcript_20567/g.51163 Transcript_20567/m.51163 type:complete len:82 (+) Transcript_20567:904-1149(+)
MDGFAAAAPVFIVNDKEFTLIIKKNTYARIDIVRCIQSILLIQFVQVRKPYANSMPQIFMVTNIFLWGEESGRKSIDTKFK